MIKQLIVHFWFFWLLNSVLCTFTLFTVSLSCYRAGSGKDLTWAVIRCFLRWQQARKDCSIFIPNITESSLSLQDEKWNLTGFLDSVLQTFLVVVNVMFSSVFCGFLDLFFFHWMFWSHKGVQLKCSDCLESQILFRFTS